MVPDGDHVSSNGRSPQTKTHSDLLCATVARVEGEAECVRCNPILRVL